MRFQASVRHVRHHLLLPLFRYVSPPRNFLKLSRCSLSPRYSLRHDGELTVEGLEEFERRYFAGELRPHTKSETVSEEDEVGPVKRVKAASFERMVIDNGELVRILRLTFANRECYIFRNPARLRPVVIHTRGELLHWVTHSHTHQRRQR